jgi:hypothetical protein
MGCLIVVFAFVAIQLINAGQYWPAAILGSAVALACGYAMAHYGESK